MTHPQLPTWPAGGADGFRRSEVSAHVGSGDDVWDRASRDILHWMVKTRSGFHVDDARAVTSGARLTITARVLDITVREPVEVADVVITPSRVGFAYRTLAGHPVSGEEAFIVHREGTDVFLTVRSLTSPAPQQPWRSLHPLLRVAQIVARRRYLRSLR
ncbi:Uncharacterized protein, UPF0548 family [Agromyces sp. CF514]|uniref:DUF1990 family protein n=1 Tax=Agromyces sp. CF514 TaxID=1881031 RepID=UPI0008EF9EFF|nr:DUF1990 domain-containing protein [Agromyces sp. CF514]SFR92039.1 Uncharacterized protein, UPF0548 family [Agromyces sp. CF514]